MSDATLLGNLILVAAAAHDSVYLAHDTAYGINNRSGWSVTLDGCVLVQFADEPAGALAEALRRSP